MSDPTIYKYDLFGCNNEIEMPAGAKVLEVGFQSRLRLDGSGENVLCLWAVVYPDRPKEMRGFTLIPTGGIEPFPSTHLRTVIDNQHGLVWHVYEVSPS